MYPCHHHPTERSLRNTPRNQFPFASPLQVFLLQALLRGQQYPRNRAAYDALAKAGKPWDKLVAAPLARVAEDPLFRVAEEWTLPQFQKKLAGKKISLPRATSVESMLCTHGNRRATWYAIFECGEITSRQVRRGALNRRNVEQWLRAMFSCFVESIPGPENVGTRSSCRRLTGTI